MPYAPAGWLLMAARARVREDFGAGKPPSTRRSNVNRNQVKGTAKDVAGKVQETAGQVTGSTSQQVKGVGKQIEGKIQKGIGDIEEAAKDADKRTRR